MKDQVRRLRQFYSLGSGRENVVLFRRRRETNRGEKITRINVRVSFRRGGHVQGLFLTKRVMECKEGI